MAYMSPITNRYYPFWEADDSTTDSLSNYILRDFLVERARYAAFQLQYYWEGK